MGGPHTHPPHNRRMIAISMAYDRLASISRNRRNVTAALCRIRLYKSARYVVRRSNRRGPPQNRRKRHFGNGRYPPQGHFGVGRAIMCRMSAFRP